MKTSKKDLLRAYDALASAIITTNNTLATVKNLSPSDADKAIDLVMNAVNAQRERGLALITLTENASARCDGSTVAMCERLIDKSTGVIANALGWNRGSVPLPTAEEVAAYFAS